MQNLVQNTTNSRQYQSDIQSESQKQPKDESQDQDLKWDESVEQ